MWVCVYEMPYPSEYPQRVFIVRRTPTFSCILRLACRRNFDLGPSFRGCRTGTDSLRCPFNKKRAGKSARPTQITAELCSAWTGEGARPSTFLLAAAARAAAAHALIAT